MPKSLDSDGPVTEVWTLDASAGLGAGPWRLCGTDDMLDDFDIEAASLADAGEIGDLYVASRAAALPFLHEVHSPEEMRTWIRDVLLPRGTTWVARYGDRICGFMTLDDDEIDQLYLHPDMRRRGIGTGLITHAKAKRPRGLKLVTFQENNAARAFYEAHGFVPVAFGNGSGNAEGAPDVFYKWTPPS